MEWLEVAVEKLHEQHSKLPSEPKRHGFEERLELGLRLGLMLAVLKDENEFFCKESNMGPLHSKKVAELLERNLFAVGLKQHFQLKNILQQVEGFLHMCQNLLPMQHYHHHTAQNSRLQQKVSRERLKGEKSEVALEVEVENKLDLHVCALTASALTKLGLLKSFLFFVAL